MMFTINQLFKYRVKPMETAILKYSPEYLPTQLFQRGMMFHPLQYKIQYRLQPPVNIICQTFLPLSKLCQPHHLKSLRKIEILANKCH